MHMHDVEVLSHSVARIQSLTGSLWRHIGIRIAPEGRSINQSLIRSPFEGT